MEGLDLSSLLIVAGILVVVIFITIVSILSRYKKCPPDKILIVYGKSSKDKDGSRKPAKIIHGGSTFIWPYLQGFDFMSLTPVQFNCTINDALSSQYIRVTVPITVTVAVNPEEPNVQNAVSRLTGLQDQEIIEMTREIVYGQFREIISKLSIEDLNADREKFKSSCEQSIATELNKLGLKLLNINIIDIQDGVDYTENIGKKEAAKALNQAMIETAEQERLGKVQTAEINKDRDASVAATERDRSVALATAKQEQDTKVAEAEKQRVTAIALTKSEQESRVAEANAMKEINVAKARSDQESKVAEVTTQKEINIANYESEMAIKKAMAEKEAKVGENEAEKEVAISIGELEVTKAEADRKAREAKVIADAKVKERAELQQKAIEEARAIKVETQLKAEKIVPAEIEKEKAKLAAEAYKNEVVGRAEAEAAAVKAKAEAEAAAIKMKQEAEAAGKLAILEAEAEGKRKAALAEAEGFQAVMNAAKGNEVLAIQYKMIDQYKEIAGEQVKAFENIKLGNINIIDTGKGEGASNFIKNMVDTIAPATTVLKEMPVIGTLVKSIEEKANSKQKGESSDVKFEEVK